MTKLRKWAVMAAGLLAMFTTSSCGYVQARATGQVAPAPPPAAVEYRECALPLDHSRTFVVRTDDPGTIARLQCGPWQKPVAP